MAPGTAVFGFQLPAVFQSVPTAPVQMTVLAGGVIVQFTLPPPSMLFVAVIVLPPLALLFWGSTYWAAGAALVTLKNHAEPAALLTRFIRDEAAPCRVSVPETDCVLPAVKMRDLFPVVQARLLNDVEPLRVDD